MEQEHKKIKELIDKAKSGNEEAFSEIYNEYFSPVYKYSLLRVKNIHIAEDITQGVFLKYFENIKTFEWQDKSPLAYLFTIARNSIINEWRKNKKLIKDVSIETLLDKEISNESPEEDVRDSELAKTIRNHLKDLTEDQEELIILKFFNQLSNTEIAKILNKNEEAIRQLQFRALRSLREKLNGLI